MNHVQATGRRQLISPRAFHLAASAVVGMTCLAAPTPSTADPIYDRDTIVAVRDRDHPEYDPLGITAGAFRIFPRLAGGATYDDNIYAVNAKTGDLVFNIHPSLNVRSLWSRDEVRLTFDYDDQRYVNHASQDTASYSGDLIGRLDVDRNSSVALDVSAAHAIQPRISQNSIAGVLDPIRYDLVRGDLYGFKVFDRIKTSIRLDALKYSYDNAVDATGAPVQEDYQDHDELVGTARADYAVSPATIMFVEGAVNDHTYRLQPPLSQFRRNSHGYDVLAGVDFAATHLIGGTIGVGYQSQRYDDHQFDGVSGLAVRGELRWYATPLITVIIGANRTFQDSGLPNVAAARFTEETATVDYELLRNVILGARYFHQVYEYPGLDGRDNRDGGALNATYTLNRDLSVILAYNYVQQRSSSDNSGLNFSDNRVSLTVTLRR